MLRRSTLRASPKAGTCRRRRGGQDQLAGGWAGFGGRQAPPRLKAASGSGGLAATVSNRQRAPCRRRRVLTGTAWAWHCWASSHRQAAKAPTPCPASMSVSGGSTSGRRPISRHSCMFGAAVSMAQVVRVQKGGRGGRMSQAEDGTSSEDSQHPAVQSTPRQVNALHGMHCLLPNSNKNAHLLQPRVVVNSVAQGALGAAAWGSTQGRWRRAPRVCRPPPRCLHGICCTAAATNAGGALRQRV